MAETESISELSGASPPPIDATDIVLSENALGMGKPWESSNAALDADGGSTDIMKLLTPQGISPELQNEFKRIQNEKMGATGQIQRQNEQRYNEDRQRVLQGFNAEQATLNDIPKWDVAQEREKYKTDPIESFGSFASVFAMVASAFTRAPMENALNGAAAAMNAKRENNEFEYQRSLDAFKINADLAVKRFNMQHTAMQDAFGIMDKDAARGNAKLLEVATKYGDEQVLALYNAGMFPEIQKLENSRLQASVGVANAVTNFNRMEDQQKRTKLTEQRDQLRNEIERQKLVVASERDADKRALEEKKLEGLNDRFSQSFGLSERRVNDQERRTDLTAGRDAERTETNKKRLEIAEKRAGKDSYLQTRPRQEAAEVARRTVELEEQGKPHGEAYDQAVRESKTRQTGNITPNRVEQLKAHIEQYDYAVEGIERLEKSVKGVKGAFGIGGKIARPTETFLNVVGGSNSTVYRQVEKEIAELKLRTAKLLKDSPSSGRELSSVQNLVDSLVPGMTAGSSFQSVMQQMEHLKAEFKTIQKNARKRLEEGTGGSPPKADEPGTPPASDESNTNWWSTSPLKK